MLSLRSAPPPFRLTQEEFHAGVAREWYRGLGDVDRLRAQTRVRQRYMFWDPRQELAGRERRTGDRMVAFEQSVIGVAQKSVEAVLEGVDRERVGSFVTTTNTGYFAPFFDCVIARRLKLNSSLRRTRSSGAWGTSRPSTPSRWPWTAWPREPDELVLVNCTEASSIRACSPFHQGAGRRQYLLVTRAPPC